MSSTFCDTETITKQLWEAAQRQKICSVKFSNEPDNRIVFPYGICQTGKNKIVIVCWQESGYSGNSKLPGYRNLSLLDRTMVETLDRHFLKRSDFNPQDDQYTDWVFHI